MSTARTRKEDVPQPVAFSCRCGKKWTQSLRHYEIVRCSCGLFWWVLQPLRDGPFKSFKWTPPAPAIRPQEQFA